jgi:hypothetical protein
MEITDNEKQNWDSLKRWHLDDIDILGGFYSGLIFKEKDDSDKKINKYLVRSGGNRRNKSKKIYRVNNKEYEESGSKEVFLNFVKNYINEFYKIKIKTNKKSWSAAEILYDHFRCGFMHEGHAKLGTGIVKSNDKEIIKFNIENVPIVLNILYLRDLVRKAVFEFEDDVFVKQEKANVRRFKDRFEYLTSEYRL